MRRLWRRIILAIAIGAGVPAPLLAWPRDPAPPQLVVSLRLDKATFESGEAVPITVEILNRGESEYAVQTSTEDTGALDGCVFTVMDGNGEAVPTPRELPKSSNWIGSWLVLKRNEKYERKLFLNHWFLPLAPRGRRSARQTPNSSSRRRQKRNSTCVWTVSPNKPRRATLSPSISSGSRARGKPSNRCWLRCTTMI
jgi:hypothetical protein